MITNQQFIQMVFGDDAPYCHVTSFMHDPANIPSNEHLKAWMGNWFSRYTIQPGSNQYFTISIFNPDENGKARRRKALYLRTPCIVLDDVREKLDVEQASKLPEPSWILETSPGSEQWGYILNAPCEDRSRVENLLDGLVDSGLAPEGKDPGMKGVTRYVRLPEGYNLKASKMVDGQPFKCVMKKWQPFCRSTMEQLAAPFAVDLDAPRREARVDGAADIPDHPLLQVPDDVIHIKGAISKGRFDITCPWVDEHKDKVDNGAAIITNSDGTFGFKCHHGHCEHRTGKDLLELLNEQVPGFGEQLNNWQCMRVFKEIAIDAPTDRLNPAGLFAGFEVSEEVIESMSDPDFIYPNLLIRGHLAVFPAPPNAGKTTLFLHIAQALAADEYDVFYVNADISGGDAKPMWRMAKEAGFTLLLPDIANKSMDDFVDRLKALSLSGDDLSNMVVIVDTLKKMTDVINKKASKEIYKLLRSLTGKGVTVVLLAHTNKYKDDEGNPIYEGTGDLRADVDELIYLDAIKNPDGTMLISTRPDKVRGQFEPITFRISKDRSVELQTEYVDAHKLNTVVTKFKQHEELIATIDRAIDGGCENQSQIVSFCKQAGYGMPKIRACLAQFSNSEDPYRRWEAGRGANNAISYRKKSEPEMTFL